MSSKSDSVVDTRLETISTGNYSKSAHPKLVFPIIIIYNSHGSLPVQSCACQIKKSDSAVKITANKMDNNNKTIVSHANMEVVVYTVYVSYIDQTQGSYMIKHWYLNLTFWSVEAGWYY